MCSCKPVCIDHGLLAELNSQSVHSDLKETNPQVSSASRNWGGLRGALGFGGTSGHGNGGNLCLGDGVSPVVRSLTVTKTLNSYDITLLPSPLRALSRSVLSCAGCAGCRVNVLREIQRCELRQRIHLERRRTTSVIAVSVPQH